MKDRCIFRDPWDEKSQVSVQKDRLGRWWYLWGGLSCVMIDEDQGLEIIHDYRAYLRDQVLSRKRVTA